MGFRNILIMVILIVVLWGCAIIGGVVAQRFATPM
jgi:hypothetical protein